MKLPLISVVIPTCGRPQYLPRAVSSALEHMGDDVEVIVVPNGPDESWKLSLTPFALDKRVCIEPVTTANANVARNHGMALARGKYLRFLDDDDYLFPDASEKQLEVMQRCGAEICSGVVQRVSTDGVADLMVQQDDSDIVRAIVRPNRVCLPTAHLLLKDAVLRLRWNETLRWEQDTAWMINLCTQREWNWKSVPYTVGQWNHHAAARTSMTVSHSQRAKFTTALLLDLEKALRCRSMLTDIRADAISEGLWHYAHSNFFRNPLYWSQVAHVAILLNPLRRPPDNFYDSRLGSKVHPILIEYLLVPGRCIKELLRKAGIKNILFHEFNIVNKLIK